MRELYFYWRTKPGQDAVALAAVRAFQQRWRERVGGLGARLLKRADGGRTTWMEVYAHPGGIDAELQQSLADEGAALLGPALDGPRHLEVFEPVES